MSFRLLSFIRHARLDFMLLSALATCLAAQEAPQFERRDPGKLRCRVASMRTNKANVTVLEVVVSNGTNCTAEPLRFTIESKRRKKQAQPPIQTFERARMPLVGRFGAGIAPGKSRRYSLQAYLPKAKKPKVRVAAASFFRKAAKRSADAAPVAKDLTAGRGTNAFLGKTFDIATFALHNPLPHAADIWVRATYSKPVKDELLLAYRVPAGQTRSVEVGNLPHTQAFDDSGKAFATDVALDAVEVVDWISIGNIEHESAKQQFLDSYAGWHRWPDRIRKLTAAFTTEEIGVDRHNKADVKVKISGTLVVDAAREVEVTLDKRSQRRIAKLIKDDTGFFWPSTGFLQSQAARYLRRRSVADVERDNQLKWLTESSVQLLGPSFMTSLRSSWTAGSDGYAANAPRFVLDDQGRIERDGWGTQESNDWTWTSAKLGDGWVVAKRHTSPRSSSRAETESWQHARQDGIAVLSEYTRLVTNNGELETRQTIKFSNWQFETAPGAKRAADAPASSGPPPAGPGAEELAAPWANLYQFSAARPKWTAELSVATSGTDLSWQGHHRFAASMTRSGFGIRKPELTLDLQGAASPAVEADLASVYLDRIGMWFGSDPQSMGPFEEAFAGATIGARSRKGWHQVEDHAVAEVRTRAGKVTEFRMRNGVHRRFHYEDFDGVSLITRIERDVARKTEVRMRPARLQEWIVPTRYEFRRIFGDDWGPEIFSLTKLRLQP
ncbi:MAG: hypothetical protein AB8H80_19660 [Planctomycetota bacterium]